MEYYIFAFIFFYISLLLASRLYKCGSVFIFIGIFPLFFMAVFRGDVGTDTVNYLEIMRATGDLNGLTSIEPLFYGISAGLMFLFGNERVSLAFLGVLITLTLFAASFKLDKSNFIFGSCVIPVFYQGMTMNGVRYGLAFSIVVLAVAFFFDGRRKLFFFLALISGLVHVSGLMLAFMFYIFFEKNIKLHLLFVVFLVGSLTLFFLGDMIALKFMGYIYSQSPSVFSGVSVLILSFLAIYVLGDIESPGFYSSFRFLLIVFLVIGSFAISKISYAGLRFQALSLFLIFLILQYKTSSEGLVLKGRTRLTLLVIGLLGLGFNLNNYIDEGGNGDSPFLPYKFVWS